MKINELLLGVKTIKIFVFMLVCCFCTDGMCGVFAFEEAVGYKPPPNVIISWGALFSEPGDSPFSGDGLGFECIGGCNSVIFQVGLVRFRIGEGKSVQFLSTKPSDLKAELEDSYKGKIGGLGPAILGQMTGLTTVCLTGTNSVNAEPRYIQQRWIQLETNLVLKISVDSCDSGNFQALTNSLQTLKIDKAKILKSLKVKEKAE